MLQRHQGNRSAALKTVTSRDVRTRTAGIHPGRNQFLMFHYIAQEFLRGDPCVTTRFLIGCTPNIIWHSSRTPCATRFAGRPRLRPDSESQSRPSAAP
jgi:hypothetical protein